MRNAYTIFIGRVKRKRQFLRPRHRWEDNIEVDLKEIGFENVDLINLLRVVSGGGGLVNTVMNL